MILISIKEDYIFSVLFLTKYEKLKSKFNEITIHIFRAPSEKNFLIRPWFDIYDAFTTYVSVRSDRNASTTFNITAGAV
jgi:hypothetical protein